MIERAYGHRPFYLWAREDGQIKGVLPLILLRTIFGKRSFVSLPFLDEGGILAKDSRPTHELYSAALSLYHDFRADYLDLRHRRPNGLPLPSNPSKVTLTLALSQDTDEMWRHFSAKLRNQIRKAAKSGLTASWHGLGGLSDF